ncbi:MAG: hypothetical protein B6D55_02245 [Candidatus Omnitrophica bacterium 4484_70.2]|nr:MAG: hypothetical protein B6D55_02245 [Candidatus Omnitrophica bacterium 4484_70.2]
MVVMKRGRPQLPPEKRRTRFTLRLSPFTLSKLDYLKKKEKMTKTEIIETALLSYLSVKELIKILRKKGNIYEIKTLLLIKGYSKRDVERILNE